MVFRHLLVATLAWRIQAQDSFNFTVQLDKARPAIFDWRITKDDRTDFKCNLKCDLGESNAKQVLYVGTSDKKIDVFDWQKGIRKFVKSGSGTMMTHGIPWLFLMDAPRNRLISMQNKSGDVGEILESFDLMTSPGSRVSRQSGSIFFVGAALHSSGKFLLTSETDLPGRMFALDVKDNDPLTIFATYTPPKPAKGYITQVFHPKANDVLAVAYPNLEVIKFLLFDAKKKTITSIADVEESEKPISLIFSSDGGYMYVTTYQYKISTYKVDVTNFVVIVGPKIGSASIQRAGDQENGLPIDLMALSPSQEYLYVIAYCYNYVAMFNISSSNHKLLPNGFKATGGSCSHGLAMAPDGSHLLLCEREKEIVIFNIQTDGTLEEAGKIEGVINPTAMLYSTK